MPHQYISVEGEVTAADTKTQLTTLGSAGTVAPLKVPPPVSGNESILLGVFVAGMSNFAAAGSATLLIRLEGPGMAESEETLSVGAYGGESTTGASAILPARYIPLNVRAKANAEVKVFAEMNGNDDIGQISVGVTLVYN